MYKILGKHIEKGEYNGNKYHKIVFSCQLTELSKRYHDVEGIVVDIVRCPYNEQISKLRINQVVTFLYDKYGHVIDYKERS